MKLSFACLFLAGSCLLAGAGAFGAERQNAAANAPTANQASGGIYTNCSACHGASGQGGFGPPFKGNPNLANTDYLLTITLRGGARMPAFGEQLSDQEIATVLSTIRSMWGSGQPSIPAKTVAQMRTRLGRQ
jgi:mono/diheme cytochrome c family protein